MSIYNVSGLYVTCADGRTFKVIRHKYLSSDRNDPQRAFGIEAEDADRRIRFFRGFGAIYDGMVVENCTRCYGRFTDLSIATSLAPCVIHVNKNERKGKSVMQKIKIQYLDETIKKLEYVDGKSDWIDLAAAETVTLKKGEFKLIHLGVAMKLPEGYEAHLVPRSSTYKNFKVIQTNHMGVIDCSYCGPNDWWRLPVYAMEDTVIEKGSRIAQFRIMENQPKLVFEEGTLEGDDRGGFGSTGKK